MLSLIQLAINKLKEFMFFARKMAAYPVTWSSDIKFDVTYGLLGLENCINDIYLDCSR